MRRALSVAFVEAHNWWGRRIARHEFSADQPQYSHTAIALGNGKVWESTFPWPRITNEESWNGATWFSYDGPTSVRELRSAAYAMEGRVLYDLKALAKFGFGWWLGRPRNRGHGLWCSYGVAELLHVGANIDVSRCRQPWNVGLRDLWLYVSTAPGWRAIEEPPATASTGASSPAITWTETDAWTGGET